ncbi:MAG: hypothetical protein LC122_01950 [Chitinophagales bacterium]|nr:hypothetical protein [Chitinophagales bacterium]
MEFTYKHLIPEEFSSTSKIWIYQSNRKFAMSEALQIEALMEEFLGRWKSHGHPVKGYFNLFFGQFLVLMADDKVSIGGCSTYESVKVLKKIETMFNVSLFDRHTMAFIVNDKIELLPLAQLNYALEHNHIQPTTLYFNNLVATKEELLNSWIIPAKDSWLKSRINVTV